MKDQTNFDLGSNKNIPDIILRDVPIVDDLSRRSMRVEFHVHALEEEMKKIEAFKRELPHCMQLLRDAIERLKEGSGREMVEELELAVMRNNGGEGMAKASNNIMEKKNWMSSVQLCTPVSRNQDSVFHLRGRFFEEGEGSGSGSKLGKEGGAFSPFKKQSGELKEKQGTAPIDGLSLAVPKAEVATNELTLNGFGRAKSEQPQQQEQQKKHRRCWSPELHKIFVDALHQLGGAQTATPKQIRELMRVEGLTNDEVKSHLQKYRIHIKKVDPAGASSSREQLAVSGSPQGPLQGGKAAKGGSAATGGDSVEDEDDGKSESHGWKGKLLEKPFL